MIVLIFASQIAEITGMSHQHPADTFFCLFKSAVDLL
jgi:hypothetical protein